MTKKQQRQMQKSKEKLRAELPDKTEFYKKETKRFYDNNLMTLLYKEDEYAFCNYANQCYLFFPHRYADFAIILNKNALIYAVRNPFEFFCHMISQEQEYFSSQTLVINDRLFEHAIKTKENTDQNGHSEFVEPELDEIIKKYGRDIPESVYEDYILRH